MALPKKGRRNLEVNGEHFHWLISRKLQYRKGTNDADMRLTVVVQHADGEGARLEAQFEGEFSLAVPANGFNDDQTVTLTPASVRSVIERAITLGWKPRERGPVVVLRHEERNHPEATRPLISDRSFDPGKLDEYLQGATLIWDKGD
jgi:hypothetical protein